MSTRLLITLRGAPLHMVGETGGSCGKRGALSLNRRHVPRRARVCLQKEGLARSLFLSDAPGYPLPGYHFPKLTHNWFGVARSANHSGKWDARLASAPRRPHIAPMPVQAAGYGKLRIPAHLGVALRQPRRRPGPQTLENPGLPRITDKRFPSRNCCRDRRRSPRTTGRLCPSALLWPTISPGRPRWGEGCTTRRRSSRKRRPSRS
jgi:hypothetical protein